ncbi:transposase [Raoultella ornithinolytica]|uniref:transposase n=1 Tax=Raoultella ornithinolytica TaxID=54291 RepID=UPI00096A7901|nr:transposase [Raoultella ornithinolytica]
MSHQLTFADSEFSTKRRQTRKEIFLSRMEQILPWQNMVEVIEPFYPKAGNGRRPYPLETYMKASIRARVEHPFRIIKRQFGFVKARYKGLLKNDNQLAMLFTLANLFRVDQMIRQWERSQ